MKTIVSYGGGTNSSAMLIGLYERGLRPDAITFADTGGEKPHTYTHVVLVNKWCEKVGFPRIETLSGSMPMQVFDGTLEQECLRLGKLPAKAYGFSSCSDKWKMDPQRKYNKEFASIHGIELRDITRLIGFDADEQSRVDRGQASAHKREVQEQYPLHEWGWGREDCVAAIARAGLPQPGKAACFFCPSSKKHEIITLAQDYPALVRRAVQMERRALAGDGQAPQTTSAGLGRNFSWESLLAGKVDLGEYGMPEIDCGCYDGE
jgi:hypothetical protein